jgi:seryl-tRNA synthetase
MLNDANNDHLAYFFGIVFMIDLALLRTSFELVKKLIHARDQEFDIKKLFNLDKQLRDERVKLEDLHHQKKQLSQQGAQGLPDELREQSITLGKQILQQKALVDATQNSFDVLYLSCPNIIFEDVPIGGKEANKPVSTFGEKKVISNPKTHYELVTALDWVDFPCASTMTGNNFALYKGEAVSLMYALAMFLLKNNKKHGFVPIMPPLMINDRSLEVAGNFPKFKDEVYKVENEDLYLAPTSEVNLTNMYREHVFAQKDLPVRMTAFTSCFRKEAGGYGTSEKGLIRMHQFEKVELYSLCEPDKSQKELEKIIGCAEDILQQLGLHYRVSLLAGGDTSFQSAKTYDIEVWLPGQKEYREISSCSNCTDFQSRRGMIRYKPDGQKKNKLVHTLNGSSLALSRLMVALVETYQQPDGRIAIPKNLKDNYPF